MDAFHQLWEARKYGARVALYGPMINNSEHQRTFIQHLRWIADGQISDPAEAVRSYHGALQKLGIQPYRAMDDDLKKTLRSSAYGGTAGVTKAGQASHDATKPSVASMDEEPDFAAMSPAQKVAWNRRRWDRILG